MRFVQVCTKELRHADTNYICSSTETSTSEAHPSAPMAYDASQTRLFLETTRSVLRRPTRLLCHTSVLTPPPSHGSYLADASTSPNHNSSPCLSNFRSYHIDRAAESAQWCLPLYISIVESGPTTLSSRTAITLIGCARVCVIRSPHTQTYLIDCIVAFLGSSSKGTPDCRTRRVQLPTVSVTPRQCNGFVDMTMRQWCVALVQRTELSHV
jgi:hypothetical protein